MRRSFLFLALFLLPSVAHASTGPQNLISWAAHLYDQSFENILDQANHPCTEYAEGQKIILEQVKPLIVLSDLVEWDRTPVLLKKLQETWRMDTQFIMELAQDTFLRINWVEDHLNLTFEKDTPDGWTFMLLGLVEIETQEDGTSLLSIKPHKDLVHYQFHNEKTQEKYFPGFIIEPKSD